MSMSSQADPNGGSPYDLLSVLRSTPTRELWGRALLMLLHGAYDALLIQLGSPEEFVRVNVAESSDLALAENEFGIALEHLVVQWQTSAVAPVPYVERILSLVAAFTPPSGFHKILGQLETAGGFFVEPQEERSSLLQRALIALQNYYQVHPSPEASDLSFIAYTAFLGTRLTDDPRVAPHACKRLLELGLITAKSDEFKLVLTQQPVELLTEVLREYLFFRTSLRASVISDVYRQCLITNHTTDFQDIIERFGGRVQYGTQPSVVLPRNNQVVELYISPELADRYTRVMIRQGDAQGLTKLKAILEGMQQ